MYGRFAFNVDYDSSDWRGKKEAGGGSMMDQGCYMVNVLNHVAREAPDRVFCRTQYHPSNGLDVSHHGLMMYNNGFVGHFESSQTPAWREELYIYGTLGTLVIPWLLLPMGRPYHLEVQRDGPFQERKTERFHCGDDDSYHLQLENVYECLFNDGAPKVPLEESVRNLHTITALLESGETGRVVTVL
jgi:predicted dehydrogenase